MTSLTTTPFFSYCIPSMVFLTILFFSCDETKQSYQSFKVDSGIEIDGKLDTIWGYQDVRGVFNKVRKPEYWEGNRDLSADFRISYDSFGICLFFEIIDDVLYTNRNTSEYIEDPENVLYTYNFSRDQQLWNAEEYDFVRLDFSSLGRYYSLLFNYGLDTVFVYPTIPTSGILMKQNEVQNGYNMEIEIPWQTLRVVPEKGLEIGLEIVIGDNDKQYIYDENTFGNAETVMMWANDDPDEYVDWYRLASNSTNVVSGKLLLEQIYGGLK